MALFKKIHENNFREIRPDDPDKKGIFLFWELFRRKFWSYIKLNLLYVCTSIISLVFYWMVLADLIVRGIRSLPEAALDEITTTAKMMPDELISAFSFLYAAIGALLLVTLFGGGVCSAGCPGHLELTQQIRVAKNEIKKAAKLKK